jgi:hypothetical protein
MQGAAPAEVLRFAPKADFESLTATRGVCALTEDFDHDDVHELHSILEALDDIAGTVEAIVLSFASEKEREAYLALVEDCGAYAETLHEEPAQRSPAQAAKLAELEGRMDGAFTAILAASPEHIRKLHDAIRAAFDAEEQAVL